MNIKLLGRKLMMTTVDKNGKGVPVTIFHVPAPTVYSITDIDEENVRIKLAFFPVAENDIRKLTVSHSGIYRSANMTPHYRMIECSINRKSDLFDKIRISEKIRLSDLCKEGIKISVRDKVKGRGFTGAMKRHGFHGLRATHGVSISHRSHGSVGCRAYPGKVIKGKRMAGRYGGHYVKIGNLKILTVNDDENIIAIVGATPGHYNSISQLEYLK